MILYENRILFYDFGKSVFDRLLYFKTLLVRIKNRNFIGEMNNVFHYTVDLIKEIQVTPLFIFLLFMSQCVNIYKFTRKVAAAIKKGIAVFRSDLTTIIAKKISMVNLKFEQHNSNQLNKQIQYAHLRITKRELLNRISSSESFAFRFNALIDGAIIGIPVGKVEDKTVFHQFVRENNDFRDLGLCN